MTKLLKHGSIPEYAIQVSIVEWIRRHVELRDHIFSIPNEGRRDLRFGNRLSRMGLCKGASDLMLAIPSRNYHGLFIEIKSIDGKLTPEQKEFINHRNDKGYFAKDVHSIDEAIKLIRWYMEM